ncbi:dihydrolipoamide acetyltransferase family protein [Allonocardiopsis opalescens]|uniref:Dihydrolipoamide acetyltransferase component of pyruvate dehydrogenase complex n=1 Tax=Allonocardiopsis opalescens TaxID=1144618 RepID=A0A2T0QFW9_9ACTN|nr:dihydrolipoamide acetyltransferase family protein [Allonocardiopsis opalescens]PRY02741.1 pyruvate dehydrogenase E2 component (dihydrolipoamide acetyltransferase) [Allonocardiopsis opalescens]
MSRPFLLPDLGEGLSGAEVVRWLVAVGDSVAVDQPVAEVETAKAAVEVPSPFAGRVTRLHAAEGEVVDVGAPLISIDDREPAPPAGGQAPGAVPAQRFTEPGAVIPDASPAAEPGGSGAVLVGYGTSAAAPRAGGRRARRAALRGPVRPAPAAGRPHGRVAVVSPLVRKLARDRGVDLAAVTGSGPGGLVLRRDVEAAFDGPSAPPVDGAARIPLHGVRRAAAERFTRSRREIPEATVWVDVDATAFVALKNEINAVRPERPVSLLALLARFTVLGLLRHPLLNARIDADAGEIVLNDTVHLGVAAQTPRGLMVPVVHDAQALSPPELTAELRRLAAAGRDGALTPAELTGGTFTLNNYGRFGVDGSAAIINHPEVAILGIGRIIKRPWVVDDELAVRQVAELTLAFDHRVCDGEEAGGFLRFVADCVERPSVAFATL